MRDIAAAIEKVSYDPHGQHRQIARFANVTGYHKLLWALLDDIFFVRASRTLQDVSRANTLKRQREADREWLASDSEEPFSFLWTCYHLRIDPRVVRATYQRLPSRPE